MCRSTDAKHTVCVTRMTPNPHWGSVSCQSLTENIVALGILSKQQAGRPQENGLPPDSAKDRQLSVNQERDLLHKFAFLSATRDDPDRVMAVCMEEDVKKRCVTLRVSANKGDLPGIREGFGGIARVLESASARSKLPS